jgi:DNA polymerase II small subunit
VGEVGLQLKEDPSLQVRRALAKVIEAGFQVEPDTLSVMRELATMGGLDEKVREAIEKASSLPQRPLLLSKGLFNRSETEDLSEPPYETSFSQTETDAREMETRLEVLENPGNGPAGARDTAELLQYFRDRFSRISHILRQRSDARSAITIEEALKAPPRTKNKIICIVTDKRERPRSLLLTVEDTESQATVIVSSSVDSSISLRARSLFLDQVTCIEVSRTQGDLLIGHDFLNPDIPDRPTRGSDEELYAALLSDLHVGSQKFLSDPFQRFLRWVQGDYGDDTIRRMARRLKYIVIAGDLVDGIGVYPGQERELATTDIHQQYAEVAKLLSSIPPNISIIIIPGNHDATLQAIPQPSISEEYMGPLLDQVNVTSLGDPARIRLHGVELLLYHGRSLDDLVGTVPGVTYQNLEKTGVSMLRSLIRARHLAPIYGSRTPIIPQAHDHLVIEKPPDIMHCGHIHVIGYEQYRGTLLLNSGTWQAQTEFQERNGLVPTPGVAPIVNLRTLTVSPLRFYD